jgi:hypothetical protein
MLGHMNVKNVLQISLLITMYKFKILICFNWINKTPHKIPWLQLMSGRPYVGGWTGKGGELFFYRIFNNITNIYMHRPMWIR